MHSYRVRFHDEIFVCQAGSAPEALNQYAQSRGYEGPYAFSDMLDRMFPRCMTREDHAEMGRFAGAHRVERVVEAVA